MSEIEKLYLLAGIRKGRMSDEDCAEDCLDYECKNCRYSNYPPFTAEKQIELCKWLIKNYHRYVFDVIEADSFETDLAKFINEEWQDLTEEDKQQVKRILK